MLSIPSLITLLYGISKQFALVTLWPICIGEKWLLILVPKHCVTHEQCDTKPAEIGWFFSFQFGTISFTFSSLSFFNVQWPFTYGFCWNLTKENFWAFATAFSHPPSCKSLLCLLYSYKLAINGLLIMLRHFLLGCRQCLCICLLLGAHNLPPQSVSDWWYVGIVCRKWVPLNRTKERQTTRNLLARSFAYHRFLPIHVGVAASFTGS